MKLNKKVCQKFAESKWSMNLNHGLFCVEQIQYIVKSKIGNVDRQRAFILHIYDRKKVVAGETCPLRTVFQSRKQHFTLARRDDGPTFWGSAALDNLDKYYLLRNKYVFYLVNNEKRVMQFCKTDQKDGSSCLSSL